MSKEARHHHYIPQCYLRGFLPDDDSGQLTVLDLMRHKHFTTGPRNIGGVRDFNKIEIEGLARDSIENSLSSFEGQVATELRQLEDAKNLNNETTYGVIMNLIALLAVRHPTVRNGITGFHADVSNRMMAIILSSKDRWEGTLEKMKADGVDVGENTSYEKMKEFFERGEYDIVVPNETHIELEFKGIDAILPFLFKRSWTLVLANNDTGPFVTCDRPVSLTWQDPDKLPPMMRYSPGFGMAKTEIVFPVSKNMALIGAFEIEDEVIKPQKEFIASINRRIMAFAVSQVYAPNLSFRCLDKNNTVQNGDNVLDWWQ
jgi:hypothetical protein